MNNLNRSSLLALVGLSLLIACGGGSGIGGVNGGGGVSTSLKKEIGAAVAEELGAALAGLTLDQRGAPFGFNLPIGCPTVSSIIDDDNDNILDAATWTHSNPPCNGLFPGGGTLEITGDLDVQDQSQLDNTSFSTTATGLVWTFRDAALLATETATRIGTRNRVGTADTASLAFDMVTNRVKAPVTATAHVHTIAVLNFTTNVAGAFDATAPLPSGSATLAGTVSWDRSSEHFTFVLSTPLTLAYNGACTSETQRLSDGEIDLVGSINNVAGTLKIKFGSCGAAPAVTFVPS
jgi:hypothetical protein